MTTEAELSALTVPKLKERLTALGLSTSGKKADLIARLLEVCVLHFMLYLETYPRHEDFYWVTDSSLSFRRNSHSFVLSS